MEHSTTGISPLSGIKVTRENKDKKNNEMAVF